MFLELLLFILLGCAIGIITGLIPGIHPNLVILVFGSLFGSMLSPLDVLVFLVTLAVINVMIDFIPSTLLGAPEEGTELAVLPGHRLLAAGAGLDAIKFTVMGSLFSVYVVLLLIPLMFVVVPPLFSFIRPYTALLLITIVFFMIISEQGIRKKFLGALCFFLSGAIGLLASSIPINGMMLLFPILSGMFGVPMLLLQIGKQSHIPPQGKNHIPVSESVVHQSVFSGTCAGIVAGLLPGIGSSELAALATVKGNDAGFLMTVSALTTANILLSIISLVLTGHGRSGVAVMIGDLMTVGFNELLVIVATVMITTGIGTLATLRCAKLFLRVIERVNYSLLNLLVLLFVIAMVFFITGLFGVFLLVICTALGVFTNLACVKRGTLMGVLVLPTILFFLPA